MLYCAMYCPDSAPAWAMAKLTSAGMRLSKRCARRTSAHCRRLQAGPFLSRSSSVVRGKFSKNRECEFVVEEIVDDVCGRIVAGEYLVEGKHRAEIEIGLLIELAADLVHVAVELFEHALETIEHGVESGLVAGEIGADEFLEGGGIAIFGAPELGDLMKTTLDPRLLLVAVFRNQFGLQLGDRSCSSTQVKQLPRMFWRGWKRSASRSPLNKVAR